MPDTWIPLPADIIIFYPSKYGRGKYGRGKYSRAISGDWKSITNLVDPWAATIDTPNSWVPVP